MVTVALLIMSAVCLAMVWPMERYQAAPGRAQDVLPRLTITGADITLYPPTRDIDFVTALGTRLKPLQSFMGWVDPYVDVLTCEERFGDCEPALNRQIQLGAMATAKEIAAYVALTFLGIEATLEEGPAQVASFDGALCPDDAPSRRACRVLEVGDVISTIDVGKGPVAIDTVSQLGDVLAAAKPGDIATLTVRPILSPSQERTVEVELLASPEDPNRTLIGFNPRDTRTVSLPFEFDIDTDRISGPSAGLAFTLAMIDVLSPGELAPPGGLAATGTISANGDIGPIGRLVQKTIAVKQSGARYFLVPAAQGDEEIERARRAGGSSVQIIPVATLAEAVQKMAELGGAALPTRNNSAPPA